MMGLSLSRMMAVLAKEFTQLVRDRRHFVWSIPSEGGWAPPG